MDRLRHRYAPLKSNQNTSNYEAPSSPGTSSPFLHHRSGSASNARKPQNTKAAAQRLAQVMSNQTAGDDEEEEEEDLLYESASVNLLAGVGLAGGRSTRNPSPMSVRPSTEQSASIRSAPRRPSPTRSSLEQPSSGRSTSATRSSQQSSVDQTPSARSSSATRSSQLSSVEQPIAARSSSATRSSQLSSVEQPSSARSTSTIRSSQLSSSVEQPPSARSSQAARSVQSTNSIEPVQPLSARSTSASRPNLGVKAVPLVPSSVSISLRTGVSQTPELQSDSRKDKRLSLDLGTYKHKEPAARTASSALHDELDLLHEENESLLEKLRLAEEHFEEAEARSRQLEKQVANIGEGVSLDARLLSRKEAALQQREAALKVATQSFSGGGKCDEVEALRAEAENARDEVASVFEKLNQAECSVKSLRNMMKRMILTQEEMEEIVLKRCWLARYWGLCVDHGIQSDIAAAKYEYWSSFAPLPLEIVLEAGQNAKDEKSLVYDDTEERDKLRLDVELSSEGCVESMLLVDRGLRELTSLKVEEAITLSMAQKRRPSALKSSATDDLKLPNEGQEFAETFQLSEEESEDVQFKQAWLLYFWRRAKNHGLEEDIAEERLNFWINQGDQPLDSQDSVNVERGLLELKKLGIEVQLWQASRKVIDPETTSKMLKDNDF
ncbi:PREDICTED: coiled-coil domain-containing protein SCD2-like isoform X2 [Ipomoea nil]|uniref:coiled-coil domain-containing protein SCD2-like isoform X2 n=1 Tax=Ipomoea nil TaxID=35883 RepID=UPI0009016576|nr:PREDICTED: coiled-coil domain-containing protein SCD2-like isoform X2 [Ipomoea nil]